jgi:YHS domain-containing protein
MMFVAWVIRVLLLALILRAVVSFIRGFAFGVGPRAAETGDTGACKSVALVKDPVCGTYVEPSHAVSTRTGTNVYYFCSEACRRTFSQSA